MPVKIGRAKSPIRFSHVLFDCFVRAKKQLQKLQRAGLYTEFLHGSQTNVVELNTQVPAPILRLMMIGREPPTLQRERPA